MERDVSFAVSMLGRLAGTGGLDAAFLRDHLQQEAAEARRFWYRFPVTPYNALPLSGYREEVFEAADLRTAADAGRYLSLLNDFAALVGQIGDTMRAQRERGVRLPAWAVPESMATIRGHARAAGGLLVTTDRCAGLAGHSAHRRPPHPPGAGCTARPGHRRSALCPGSAHSPATPRDRSPTDRRQSRRMPPILLGRKGSRAAPERAVLAWRRALSRADVTGSHAPA
jgi:hypothetical protein